MTSVAVKAELAVFNDAVYDRFVFVAPAAWRVWLFDSDGLWRAIDCSFERRSDAEIGLRALLNEGLDTIPKLYAKHPKLKYIMCAALPW